MPTKRQITFLASVADAARSAPRPRGRPTPANLTESGRHKGMLAIRQAPRCRGTTKLGLRCKNAALRGATRCLKHGGRVEVPNHPHNIRRFMSGKMHAYYEAQDRYLEGKAVWDAMTWREQSELLEAMPDDKRRDAQTLYAAALVWQLIDVLPCREWQKRWKETIG